MVIVGIADQGTRSRRSTRTAVGIVHPSARPLQPPSAHGSIMTILGIGVDLVHIPRIAALISRRTEAKFAAKILSRVEYAQWNALRQSASTSPSAPAVGEGGAESQKKYESRESGSAYAMQPEAEAARVRFLAVRCSPPICIHIPPSSHSLPYDYYFQFIFLGGNSDTNTDGA